MSDLGHLSDAEVLAAAGLSGGARAPSAGQEPSGGSDFSHLSDAEILAAAGVTQPPQSGGGSPANAALEGFGQGATFGYLPQLQAMASKPIYAAMNAITGQDVQPDSYVAERDANIARQNQLKKENPYAYHAAQAAGMLGTAMVPGAAVEGALGKAAAAGIPGAEAAADALGGMSKAKQLALGGAGIGAIQNPGDKQGEVNPLQPVDRIENAAIGAATGLGLSKVPAMAGAVGNGVKKVVSAVSGIPEQAIERYLTNSKEIDSLAKNFGDHIADAADAVKQKWNSAIASKMATLGQQKQALLNAAGDVKVSAQPIFDALSQAQQSINQKLYPEAHAGIDALKAKIMASLGGTEGTPAQLEEIKSFLQGEAQASYQKGGNMFAGGDKLEKAAKGAAAIARKQVNAAVPEVAGVNNQFQLLHNLQDTMNRNMLKVGQSEASLVSAGANTSSRNAKALAKLGNLVGEDFSGDAQNIAALKYFGDPSLMSSHSTGKALLGMVAGHAAGGLPGTLVGMAASSPAAVKMGLKGASLLGAGARALTGAAEEAIPDAVRSAATEAAPAISNAASGAASAVRDAFSPGRPALNVPDAIRASDAPIKGPAKWANDGIDKLKDHASDDSDIDAMATKALQDPKGKQLLIQASDLKPGSKAMAAKLAQLRSRYGNATS